MKDIIIIGAGDFGKEVAWLIEDINKCKPKYIILGFLDDDETKIGKFYNGYECLGPTAYLRELTKHHHTCAVIANQDGKIRKKFVDMFPEFDEWETVIHPSVSISNTSIVGKGSVVCANANVSVNTVIGKQCLLNLSTVVGNDVSIDNYVSIMSGTCIGSHVDIKEYAFLSTNSTVLPGMKIGERAKVGAGSVVIRNVREGTTVMGVPAKKIMF